MPQKVRVKINISKPHLEFANDAVAVYEGLNGSRDFPPNPPVALDVFKAETDAYISSISESADGSKKAKVQRDKLKGNVAKSMRQLGHWVEANCQDDLVILRSSGFQAASSGRVAQGPLPQPIILKAQNGSVSGQVLLQVTPLPKARSYELRYTRNGAGGTHGEWTTLPPFPSSRMSINGLTPGVAYQFQVRAFGKAGLTDWSDAASRIAI